MSKTPFLAFVYLSKSNIKLPGMFGNSKEKGFYELVYCAGYDSYVSVVLVSVLQDVRKVLADSIISTGLIYISVL